MSYDKHMTQINKKSGCKLHCPQHKHLWRNNRIRSDNDGCNSGINLIYIKEKIVNKITNTCIKHG
jgi:hypothetical protein